MGFLSSMHRSLLILVLVVFPLLCIGGCRNPYTVEGKVIESSSPGIGFINQRKLDPILIPGYGIHRARIDVIRTPRSIRRKLVATGTTDAEGVFVIKIPEYESNWGNEEWLFRCVHPRYPVIEFFDKLPPRNGTRALVIELGPADVPGSGGAPLDEDERIRRELERFGR